MYKAPRDTRALHAPSSTANLEAMGRITVAGGGADASVDPQMLKKSQDMAMDNAVQFFAVLHPAKSPSPPRADGKVDVTEKQEI